MVAWLCKPQVPPVLGTLWDPAWDGRQEQELEAGQGWALRSGVPSSSSQNRTQDPLCFGRL